MIRAEARTAGIDATAGPPSHQPESGGDPVQAAVAPRVTLEQVSKTYPARPGRPPVEAIRRIDGVVSVGAFVSVVGPSGCGKSTLLEIVAGLIPPSSGRVVVHQPQAGLAEREDAGAHTEHRPAVVFQEDSTLPWRTVVANVELPLEILGVAGRERRQRAMAVLDLVGLADFARARPRELSGGMRQRVAIARALVGHPSLLLMDEPCGSLDQQTRLAIGEQFRRIWRQTEQTTMLVTHDIGEALYLGTEVWVLTARPAQLRLRITTPWPSDAPLVEILRSRECAELSAQIWELLREGGPL